MASILLAEDDEPLRNFLHRALERAGHAVTSVADGTQAASVASVIRFDVLIADIVMPGLDGIALSRRAVRLQPGLKVLFITGFAAVAMSARESVCDAQVLSKPFHLREIVGRVEDLLAGGQA